MLSWMLSITSAIMWMWMRRGYVIELDRNMSLSKAIAKNPHPVNTMLSFVMVQYVWLSRHKKTLAVSFTLRLIPKANLKFVLHTDRAYIARLLLCYHHVQLWKMPIYISRRRYNLRFITLFSVANWCFATMPPTVHEYSSHPLFSLFCSYNLIDEISELFEVDYSRCVLH